MKGAYESLCMCVYVCMYVSLLMCHVFSQHWIHTVLACACNLTMSGVSMKFSRLNEASMLLSRRPNYYEAKWGGEYNSRETPSMSLL